MTLEELAAATGASRADAERFVGPLTEGMLRFSITTPLEKAALCATISVESVKLTKTEESFYYKDAQRLANIYKRVFHGDATKAAPYVRNSAALSKLLYDGFHGRGLIQLTWQSNYLKYGKVLGFDYVSNPSLVAEPWHAAMTACAYFTESGCRSPANKNDMDGVTRLVNPAMMHAAERRAQFIVAKRVFL